MPWNPTPQPSAGFPRAHLRPLIISTTPPRSSFLQQVSSGSRSQPLPSWPPGGTPKKADLASGLTWAPSDNYFSPTPSPTKKSQPFAVLRTHKAHHHFHLPLKKKCPCIFIKYSSSLLRYHPRCFLLQEVLPDHPLNPSLGEAYVSFTISPCFPQPATPHCLP